MVFWIGLTGDDTYDSFVTAAPVIVLLCTIWENIGSSPYGKFTCQLKACKNFVVNPRLGWWLLEIPCTVVFLTNFRGSQANEFVPRLLGGLFCTHYIYRGWIFPYLIRSHKDSAGFHLITALGGPFATIPHAYMTARWYAEFGKHLSDEWLQNPLFLFGLVLYVSGYGGIIYHDHLLRNLRQPDGSGPKYQIPFGGLFDYATSAQYFCELVAWTGFALMGCGPNGLYILTLSLGNLVPRAIRTHAWYCEKFDDYPRSRKYIIPFLF